MGKKHTKNKLWKELTAEQKLISTPGRTKLILEPGYKFENPFGNTIEIITLYGTSIKGTPTVVYHLNKGYEEFDVSEPISEFKKKHTIYAYPGKRPMKFNHWVALNAKLYSNGNKKPPL